MRQRFDRWRPELRQAIRTLVSVFLSDIVSRLCNLHEPYWALITAVIVTQARVSATLEAGRDQIVGTLVGAAAGVLAILLRQAGLPVIPVFSVMMIPLAVLAAFKPNLRLAGVTLVVVFLFPSAGGPFSRPIDRVLAILVGAGVSLLVSYLVFHSRARALAFTAAADMLATVDRTQVQILTRRVPHAEVERFNDASSEALKALIAAIVEARRERFSAIEQHEPLMVRLVPMLRRLQSDVLFVARAADESAVSDEPVLPQLSTVSEGIARALGALRAAFLEEAASHRHSWEAAARESRALSSTIAMLGDDAGPLLRFTLQMLDRDIADVAAALKPETAPSATERPS